MIEYASDNVIFALMDHAIHNRKAWSNNNIKSLQIRRHHDHRLPF